MADPALAKYLPANHWMRSTFSCMNVELLQFVLELPQPTYCYIHYDSNNNRLDHYLPILFAKWLQQVLHNPIIVQISGDNIQAAYRAIAASGIDPHRSFIFSESSQISSMYPTICKLQKATPLANLQPALGNHDQIYEYVARITQVAPCFSVALPHILPKSARGIHITNELFASDYDKTLGSIPIIFKYNPLPPMQGKHVEHGTHICIGDSREKITENIRKLAFSGGRDTLLEHQKYGADIDVDISIIYLCALMSDQELLDSIIHDYRCGVITTSRVKDYLIEVVCDYLSIFDENLSSFDENLSSFDENLSSFDENSSKYNEIIDIMTMERQLQ